jgi:hypothetical protein
MDGKLLITFGATMWLAACSASHNGDNGFDVSRASSGASPSSGVTASEPLNQGHKPTSDPSPAQRVTDDMVVGQECVDTFLHLPRVGVLSLREWSMANRDLTVRLFAQAPVDKTKAYGVIACGIRNGDRLEIHLFAQKANAAGDVADRDVLFKDVPPGRYVLIDALGNQSLATIDTSQQTSGTF